ncbi:MAG: hypothetical protein PVJ67_04180 [Candidatus Pacearchaeota archaeon]|jgi:hypothetical protein
MNDIKEKIEELKRRILYGEVADDEERLFIINEITDLQMRLYEN